MFTGIIDGVGEVKAVEDIKGDGKKMTLQSRDYAFDLKIGGSVALNGVCCTVVHIDNNRFSVELMPETLKRTNLGTAKVGDEVNLEKPLRLNDQLSGHFVLGHVDGVAEVVASKHNGEFQDIALRLKDFSLKKFIARKGSIALNGVSLTVVDVKGDTFTVALIPHTLISTNLRYADAGRLLNVEIDMLARYVEKLNQK
ncbi:MAG: riboflavin synthase [Candidatus Buchananbacteria bacterium CG10_big_fil_rev_8_21_14_0_10_42_9]|uniref:Riboflavin synthase n=1 Tax=Candidatus Buchananbacteria bacterium CG10_big_fil_rev_8_21_14_0_10_42_9 TaxID=1974526 RepID=A0A2H0W0J1_9BACT|nr:MAG: riboflavin synthase [Candidatus Buchananbacteria bacterium CG10_big_fil_rev_8_21_14_0_10_42_9]